MEFLIFFLILVATNIFTYFFLKKKDKDQIVNVVTDLSQVNSEVRSIKKEVNLVPEEVLKAITGLNNTHKGKLGELIGYIQLKAEYDRIIPLGTIVDFVGIKFPKDKSPGEIVFIDVKTGKNAKLNSDQRSLKKTIEKGKVSFIKLNIDQIDVLEEKDDSTDSDKTS